MKQILKLILVLISGITLFAVVSLNELVINYPPYLFTLVYLLSLLLLLFLFLNEASTEYKNQKKNNQSIFAGLMVVFFLFCSYILAKVIIVPLNYYNFDYSKKNQLQVVKLEIYSLQYYNLHPNNNLFMYKFKDSVYTIHSSDDLIREIYYNNNDYNNYYVEISIREGLFQSYCIEKWEIKHK